MRHRQALPGVQLTYVPNPPSAVAMKLNYYYFLLQKSGTEWDGIAKARNVAAYVARLAADPNDVRLVLIPRVGSTLFYRGGDLRPSAGVPLDF